MQTDDKTVEGDPAVVSDQTDLEKVQEGHNAL